ncbi:hypothetical protein [Desulfolucanica intricata]
MRSAAISEMCNNVRSSWRRPYIEKICEVLEIRDLRDIFELSFKEDK